MHPTEPSRAEALAAMTPEKLEEMARPAPRASHPGLRDFLEIPYDQLEEMNLEAKEERLARRPADTVREERMQLPHRREAHQGGHRVLHRPRRPAAHAGLRQEVPAQVGRQPDLRRLVDPRLLAAGRSRTCAWRSTGRPSTGCRRTSSAPARCWSSARSASATARPYTRRHARPCSRRTPTSCTPRTAWSPTPPTRSRASSSRGATPSAPTTRPARFEFISTGGYYHSLPGDPLRQFIDTAAEVQRAMGFANEKDHPEVAPSQFEMNYCYTEASVAADQVQLYKLICRQVAAQPGHDGLLPAQAGDRRQRQRHAHQHLGDPQGGKNLFYDEGRQGRSLGRRLGLHRAASWPAPRTSAWCSTRASTRTAASTRTSRRPTRSRPRRSTAARWCASRSATSARRASRCARSLPTPTRTWRSTPCSRPGSKARQSEEDGDKRPRTRFLPDNIYDAIRLFKGSRFMQELLGEEVHAKFAELKLARPNAAPRRSAPSSRPPRCSSTTRSRTSTSGRSSKAAGPSPSFPRTAGGPSSRRPFSPPHGICLDARIRQVRFDERRWETEHGRG